MGRLGLGEIQLFYDSVWKDIIEQVEGFTVESQIRSSPRSVGKLQNLACNWILQGSVYMIEEETYHSALTDFLLIIIIIMWEMKSSDT
ncbi:hypothetical protein EVAR_34312_1 [Eumeta japonica]|uniref:Uncharacterized protein n=1 Tax=Eumeta variegata TaxID=151549 RepID=A0A4C1VD84_EUMVA|nr:hypothetical protein EVAR_34312_1 [Eumeta japonica]